MTDNRPAIDVADMTAVYHEQPVLWDVDLMVPPGVLMAIVGPNGAGKTTLIKCILGLIKPVAGSVLIQGKSYKESREAVAYVPQRGSVDWDFPTNVLDVVEMGRYGTLGWLKRPGKRSATRPCRRWKRWGWKISPIGRSANSPAVSSNASSRRGRWPRTLTSI